MGRSSGTAGAENSYSRPISRNLDDLRCVFASGMAQTRIESAKVVQWGEDKTAQARLLDRNVIKLGQLGVR